VSRARRLVRAVLAGAATAAVVLGMAVLIRGQWDPLVRLDERVVTAATQFAASSPALIRVLLDWQWVFAAARFIVPVTVVCLLFWWRTGRATRTWWALVTIAAAWGVSNLAKDVARRARPVLDHPLTNAQGYSFPSGHATTTAAMTTALVLLVWPVLRRRWMRVGAITAAVTLTLLTALDRVLLGAHYPSDVIGGMVLGAGFVLASFLGYRGWSPAPEPAPEPETVPTTEAGRR